MATQTVTCTNRSMSQVLDLASVLKASQAISSEIVVDKLLSILMQIVLDNSGAEKTVLILEKESNLVIEAKGKANNNQTEVVVLPSVRIESSAEVPVGIIKYVHQSQENLVVDNAIEQANFVNDPYIIEHKIKSILCIPLGKQEKLVGILYLENNLTTGAFTNDRIEIVNLLSSQAAISLENAYLYRKSQENTHKLEQSLQELQLTQLQLIQKEKMSILGQLLSGIAHEINNPLGFISGNIAEVNNSVNDIINHLQLYQEKVPNPGEEIVENAEDIDLDYLLEDVPQMLTSMKEGTERIRQITSSLRVFARADSNSKASFNIHEGIDSTLVILKHRLKANDKRPEINLVKDYGDLPEVQSYPGQLNQVFMNIIVNAIEAFDELNEGKSYEQIRTNPNEIKFKTEESDDNSSVVIRISDNGPGMTEEQKTQVFDYLFTTKPVGKGTGLGLSIARQIIDEKHGGKLTCISELGKGTEFIISLPVK